jgi:hypothetical protein
MVNINTSSRRDFLQSIGIGVAASTLKHTDTQALYQDPPAEAAQSYIPVRHDQTHRVATDEWPTHWFGFTTEGDEGKPALETVRSTASYTFTLDGTKVTDFHQGWTRIEQNFDDQYSYKWEYSIPPLPAGDYDYRLQIEFDDPVRTAGNTDRVWHSEYNLKGDYVVTPSTPGQRNSPQETQRTRNQRTVTTTDSVIFREG